MTDETADSDAQAHQELHCLSMWKKVKLTVFPRAYIMMTQVRKPFIVGTNLSAYYKHWHSSFVFNFILWKQSLHKSCSSNLIICFSFNGQIVHV